jgi:hypothetical protein
VTLSDILTAMSTTATVAIRSHKLRDRDFGDEWVSTIEDRWNYDDFLQNERWRKDWISFDGVLHCPLNDRIYCGITSFDADVFKIFDRESGTFIDTDFAKVVDPFDAKFHRSMELTGDGTTLYMATALLHDIDKYRDAPGGGIFRHDIRSGTTEKLGIPIPHVYVQSIALDESRGVVYGMHFTPEHLSVFDLETRKGRDLGIIGSGFAMAQGENVILDDDGCAWFGWGQTRAWQSAPGVDSLRLAKYCPLDDRIEFFERGLPRADGAYGYAKVEGLFNLGTGCLYASGDNGSLYRLDLATAKADYLGTPIADRPSRLTSLAMHTDGYAYGITGRNGSCCLLRFDSSNDTFELGNPIVDADDVAMWQCHDVAIAPDGVMYAGENDHPQRSGYLWEIQL